MRAGKYIFVMTFNYSVICRSVHTQHSSRCLHTIWGDRLGAVGSTGHGGPVVHSVLSEPHCTTETFFPALLSCSHCLPFSLAFLALSPRCTVSTPSLQCVCCPFQADTTVKSGFGVLFTEQELKQKQPKPHSLAVLELNILFPLPSVVLWGRAGAQ